MTDFGACCWFHPYMNFEPFDWSRTFVELFHDLKSEAKNGQHYSLNVLFDAEHFNYGYYTASGAGFKISLHDHRYFSFLYSYCKFCSTMTRK